MCWVKNNVLLLSLDLFPVLFASLFFYGSHSLSHQSSLFLLAGVLRYPSSRTPSPSSRGPASALTSSSSPASTSCREDRGHWRLQTSFLPVCQSASLFLAMNVILWMLSAAVLSQSLKIHFLISCRNGSP